MATHDFTAAKYRAPVAIYCGSIPQLKPGWRELRGGHINSSFHLHANGWVPENDAFLHSVLKKQSCPWGGKGESPDSSLLDCWDCRKGLQKQTSNCTGMEDPSQLPRSQPRQHLSEQEVCSAAMETAQIKDKLKKRRMSEGMLPSNKGLLDPVGPQGLALKPAISRSASQRLLITSKPVPPIQSIPTSPETNGVHGREQKVLDNNTGCLEAGEDHLKSRGATQQIPHGGDKSLRKFLGAALIPPIPKSAKANEENIQKYLKPLLLSSKLDPDPSAPEEFPETRSRPEACTTEEDSSETQGSSETGTSETTFRGNLPVDLKVAGCPLEALLPVTTPSLNLGKEAVQLPSPHLLKDNERKIHVAISKSAQEKMRQKQLKEIELLQKEREKEKEKERFMLPQEQSQKTTQEGSSPSNNNGITPLAVGLNNPCRAPIGTFLKKRVNRPSLPNIPIINHDSSFLRNASANSLPANLRDFPEWEEDFVKRNGLELRPLSHPEQGLVEALKWLNSSDWKILMADHHDDSQYSELDTALEEEEEEEEEERGHSRHLKEKGLFTIRCLASCHSQVLQCRLHDVSLAATKEVSNLRSKVSRFAIGTLEELFKTMKKQMDQEVEEISRVLLQKAGDSSEFIQKAADQSLDVMAQNVTPSRTMAALMANGVNHRNPLIRKCAAEHLLMVVEQIGAEKLLSGNRENTEALVQTLVRLAQDRNQDTRFYGRKVLHILMSHSKFDGYLKQCPPSHDLRDVMGAIKQKGAEDQVSQAPSAKSQRESKDSSLTISLDSLPLDEGSTLVAMLQSTPRRSSLRSIEVMEQLRELNNLLMAKEFQTRMEGVTLLMEYCRNNTPLVSSNIIQIFDAFTLRLQDSNKKVNQYALESLVLMIPILKEGLNPVLATVVTVVTDNLNSKNSGIYSAAMKVLDAMIVHLDHLLLLQTLASRVRFLSGRALQDITDRLSVLVALTHSRKPQAVERHILPVLWYFLNNMIGNGVLPGKSGNVRTVVSRLAQSLHKQMGPRLEEHASSQPQHVIKVFWDLLSMELS